MSTTRRILHLATLSSLVTLVSSATAPGAEGAAFALLLTRLVDCFQHYVPVARLFSGIRLARISWKPILATLCMAGYLEADRTRTNLLSGVYAGLIYVAVLLVLSMWACGGYRQFCDRYRPLFSEQ